MIRFGPQGIPLSSKGRTLRDGVQDVHMLGLSAMEVQFLRVHTNERFASEDEIGKKVCEIPEGLIIQVIQEGEKEDKIIWDINHIIEEGDILVSFSSPIAPSYSTLMDLGRLAKEFDIMLSLHTPYHMNLCGDPETARSSIRWNIWGGIMAGAMDAKVVVTNIGAVHPAGRAASFNNLRRNIDEILKQFKALKIKCKLGLQPSPRPEIFGTLDELISICKRYNGDVIPVLNFPNLYLSSGGALKDKKDIRSIVEKVKPFYRRMPYYAQFAGIESSPSGEVYYSPIKRGELKFDSIAEYLLEAMPDMIIISVSPLVEHDAMYMKTIYERILAKMELKKKKIDLRIQMTKTPALTLKKPVKKPAPSTPKKVAKSVKKIATIKKAGTPSTSKGPGKKQEMHKKVQEKTMPAKSRKALEHLAKKKPPEKSLKKRMGKKK